MQNAIEHNGIKIVRTPGGIGVDGGGVLPCYRAHPLEIEIEYAGRLLKREWINPLGGPWRDAFLGYDPLRCVIRVKTGGAVLAELGLSNEPDILPFMIVQGEQQHITENYVSVPPSLTITDEVGAVWTLGFETATKDKSPEGEFAFNVLRDGVDVQEIASRVERRNGKVRILTTQGWKIWNGQFFF